MAFERKQYYPEHDRTSCSDADPCNAEAGGSHGCARCTAIMMDERDALAERCERLQFVCQNVLGGILTGAIVCKPMMRKVNGDYVLEGVQEMLERVLAGEAP